MVAIPMDKLKEALEGYDLNPDTIDALMQLDTPEESVDIDAVRNEVRAEVEAEWSNRYREAFFKGAETIDGTPDEASDDNEGADEEATLSFDELIYGEED